MAYGFKLDRFAGLLPRLPDTLLPPTNATVADNCDFAYGELRALGADLPEHTLGSNAASLYTDDGTLFYTWDTDVNAVRSPMAADKFDRLYYTTPDDFRVTTRAGMTAAGGAPASSYRVGVPRPAAAPVIALSTTAAPVEAKTNANILPVYKSGTDVGTYEYRYGTGMGPNIATVHLTLAAAGSVAVIVSWQSVSQKGGDNFNVRCEVTADGTVMLAQSTSGLSGYTQSHTATGTAMMSAGDHVFTLNFGNDWTKGWWFLGNWSITVMPVRVQGEVIPEPDTPDDVTRAYVYTMVNEYGEEGPPSPPTLFTFPLGAVDVAIDYEPPAADYVPIKELRIYRTPDSSTIAEYFYAGAIDVKGKAAQTITWTDNTPAAELNESLASMNYYPPDPKLVGLTQLPNGILMAWKGNELHFSDAYKPWAWPPQYVLTFGDYSVVGAISVGGSTLVTTTGKPYLVAGVAPDAMTYSVLNIQQAGVSKWALADLGGQIVYASHDGIVAFDGGLPTMAFSDNFFTRDVWRARYAQGLSTMRFAVWDGRLIVYSSSNAFTPFMINMDEAKGAMTELPLLRAQGNFVSPVADQCYIVNGPTLLRLAGGPKLQATWTSRTILTPRPCSYSVAQAVCTGNWEVRFYADGILRHAQANLDGIVTFRLPGGFLSDRWKIEIRGTGSFRELRVAQTAAEMAGL